MSSILEYIDQDFCFLVVENKQNKNQYCFKFDRKPNSQFWFVSIQDGTWSEKYYTPISTIKVVNGVHQVSKNKKFDEKYQFGYNCLDYVFKNCNDSEKMKNVLLVYGKINLI